MADSADRHGLCAHELAHREDAGNHQFPGPENIVSHSNGFQLRVPAIPSIDYLRVCGPDGREIAYWSIEELRDDPAEVLGAAIGALLR